MDPVTQSRTSRLLRIARAQHAEHLLRRAQADGLIDATKLVAFRELHPESDAATILDLILAAGWMTSANLHSLQKREADELFGRVSSSSSDSTPRQREQKRNRA